MKKAIELFVCVDSENHSCDELISLIGIDPDECWDRGSTYKSVNKEFIHGFSRWAIVEEGELASDFEVILHKLMLRVEGIAGRLGALPDNVRIAMSACINQEHDIFSIGIDYKYIKLMERIRAELDMSFVVNR